MLANHKQYEISGEDVFCHPGCLSSLDIEEARTEAQIISNSEDHSWSYVWYTWENAVVREVFSRGKYLFAEKINNDTSH